MSKNFAPILVLLLAPLLCSTCLGQWDRSASDSPLKNLSESQIENKLKGLKKTDVAWRQIKWKTCLLEGVKASRLQNKPIILWVFIDRPIDDERC